MPKFQKKTEPVEAIEWTGKNLKAVEKLFPRDLRVKNDRLYVVTDNNLPEVKVGFMLLSDGDVMSAEQFEADFKEVK